MKHRVLWLVLNALIVAACSKPTRTPPPTATPTAVPAFIQSVPTRATYTAAPLPTRPGPTPFPTPFARLIPEPGTIYLKAPSLDEAGASTLYRVNSDGSGFEFVLQADNFLISPAAASIAVYDRGTPPGTAAEPVPDRLAIAGLEGEDLRPLYEAPPRYTIDWGTAAWSPDGRFIAIHTAITEDVFPQRDAAIIVISVESGDAQTVYQTAEPRDTLQMRWSPDGTTLALMQVTLDPRADYVYPLRSELIVVPREPGAPAVLFSSDEYFVSSIAWSADSRRLAYSIWMDDGDLETRPTEGIYLAEADEWEAVQLTSGLDTLGVWSTDGSMLYFRRMLDIGRFTILRARIEGPALRPLTPPLRHAGLPTWSPNGRILFFPADNAIHPLGEPFEGLFTIESVGEGIRQVASGRVRGMAWSPGSRQIAYGAITQLALTSPCRFVLVVMNADSTAATPITAEMPCADLIAWLPVSATD